MSKDHFECHLDITTCNEAAADLLAVTSGLSKSRVKQAMQKGAVWLTSRRGTQRLRRMDRVMQSGDKLHLYYNEKILLSEVDPPQLIADEGGYSVWYKPYGMLSQGSKWGDHFSINRWAEQHLTPQRPAFVVHRLDRAATGLILIAHQKKIAAALSLLFQDRGIEKRYQVIVQGRFPEQGSPLTIDTDLDNRPALTQVYPVRYDSGKNRTLLDVRIETGRKHQIRRHLSSIGYPVAGDRMYGQGTDIEDLQLTAYYLSFICPVSGAVREYVLPEDLRPHLE
ncbi:MAG: RNA pseudouridine synthase [Nitrospiraceae bacterium]|nr:MAG: RNA pseudouridine synthase [Nitrospiraceae bacterium]